MNYYKVLRNSGGILTSAFINIDSGGIVYKKGEWVSSTLGPLFIFDSYKWAESFKYHVGDIGEVWLVTAENVRPIRYMIFCERLHKEFVESFWKQTIDEHARMCYRDGSVVTRYIPLGTVVADKIKLIRRRFK